MVSAMIHDKSLKEGSVVCSGILMLHLYKTSTHETKFEY